MKNAPNLPKCLPVTAFLGALLSLVGCGGSEPATEESPLPAGTQVIVISIDTLRADRLPAYGYDKVETPHFDALRRDSVLFERAYSHIPLTLPSHASLFTGLLPPEHGLRDNIGYRLDGDAVDRGEIPFLPSLLAAEGYRTGAAVSTFVLRRKMGLAKDFELYEDSIEFRTGTGLGGLQRSGFETFELSKDWLSQVAEEPFFFFFHIYEPHTPYTPAEPFASRYSDPYDAEVATSDAILGEVLDELRRLGVYDKSLIFLLSDHGEGLGDHGEEEHGVLIYGATLQVPLFMKLPGGESAGASVSAPVQLIDILPTLTDLLGLPTPEGLRGQSLMPLLEGAQPERTLYAESFYPRLHFGWSELTTLIDERYQYIEGPDPELYDLLEDPGQHSNILRRDRNEYARLRDELATYDTTLVGPAEEDEESLAALAALGYLGGTTVTEGPLPDPKERLPTLADLKAGFRYHSLGEHAEAAEAFERALVENPGMLDAWEYLAQSLEQLGRRQEAIDAYRRALELSGGAPHLAMAAASLFLQAGQLDEAESHARLALDQHASFANGLLARVALRRDELDEAEVLARRALEAEGEEGAERIGPRVTLAGVLHAKGSFEEALEIIREAQAAFGERRTPDPELIRGLYLVAGKVHADLGRPGEAEHAFRKELELFPDEIHAYSNLAVLQALTGRPQEVPNTLRSMVEARPSPEAYAEAVRTLRALRLDPGADSLLRYALGLFPESQELRSLTSGA